MRTLVIETASEACSIALFEGERLLAHDHRVLGRGHAEKLVPMIGELPEKGRADRILVSLGPGSFTGVRIGLATARALGVAWKAEVLGYPTLRLIHAQTSRDDPKDVTVCVNGGHGEWFLQNFAASGEAEGQLLSLQPESAARNARHRTIAGNRAQECAALLDADTDAFPMLPDAQHAIQLRDADLTANLSPLYGRAPDATPQKANTPEVAAQS
jgi:tRNA threonylcarbamoyladenosine biosynthesis protein TsaB